jgi:hypothetical protein
LTVCCSTNPPTFDNQGLNEVDMYFPISLGSIVVILLVLWLVGAV